MEEALEQANALLRAQGIDPTGEGFSGHSDNVSPAIPEPSPGPSPSPAGSSTATAVFSPLTIEGIRGDTDVWPARIVMLETVDFRGGPRLTPGNQVVFTGFADDENINLHYGNYNLTVPFGYTDLLERANDIARGQAKAEGFKGRLLEQLDGRLSVLSGNEMVRSDAGVIEGADLYLFYMSSDACGWCQRFTPNLTRTVEQIQRQFPGRLRVVLASVDRNMGEFQANYRKISADAAIPPGDRWFIDGYATLNNVTQITQPSLMLFNVNGRLIDSGGRQGSDTSYVEGVLNRLPAHVRNADSLSPAWTRLERPIPLQAPGVAAASFSLPEPVQSIDPSIAGPEPYPGVMPDGTAIPGLILYDRTATGNRVPAITLQRFPSPQTGGYYYVLAFRQVLGTTVSSSTPVLTAWLLSTTRSGADVERDLAARVADFKALYDRFENWKQTAVSNGVTEFQKPIYTIPRTYVDNPRLRPAIAAPGSSPIETRDLEIVFVVMDNAEMATLKTETITWMKADINAFTRLIPQIDLLPQQIKNEAARVQQERSQQVKDVQNIDALFQ